MFFPALSNRAQLPASEAGWAEANFHLYEYITGFKGKVPLFRLDC